MKTSETATPRRTRSARAVTTSNTTRRVPWSVPGLAEVTPFPIQIEASEPGGVN